MHRRTFLKNTALLAGAACSPQAVPGFGISLPPSSPFKLGSISDGFSQDFEKALQAMQGFGLSWVEIRHIWGKYNTDATPEEIRRVKSLLDRYHFQCSVVDSAFYKCPLPGTKPLGREASPQLYAGQMDLLKRAMDRAHAWGCDTVRGFTFWRVEKPQTLFPRIAEELTKAAEVAEKEGIRLAIENEESCNAATGHEIAAVLKLAPAHNLGYNWDVGNGYMHGEVSYPDGYNALEKNRIMNVHLKGMQCGPGLTNCHETFPDEGQIDLVGQLRAFLRDHYAGTMSLEGEYRGPGMTREQSTERSMQGLLRVVEKALA